MGNSCTSLFVIMLVTCLAVSTAALAAEVTVNFREGGGTGYSHVEWDVTDIHINGYNVAVPRSAERYYIYCDDSNFNDDEVALVDVRIS